jgi:hypothetical protein
MRERVGWLSVWELHVLGGNERDIRGNEIGMSNMIAVDLRHCVGILLSLFITSLQINA